jgi:hypothetical protein
MTSIETDQVETRRLETLARIILRVKEEKSVLNRAVKNLDVERIEAEAEIMLLLETGGGTHRIGALGKSLRNGESFVVIGKRSGGGHFVKPWQKDTVVIADVAYMERHNLLSRV